MADAKKCDRCGSYYEPYNLSRIAGSNAVDEMLLTPLRHLLDEMRPTPLGHVLIEQWELCPVCSAYLHAVLRIEPIKEIGGGDR